MQDKEADMVDFDHSYSKLWNWRPDSAGNVIPVRNILVPKVNRNHFRLAQNAG